MNTCSLVLGTAQFGFNYGIANKSGRPDQSTANAIVREAWESGIHEFDTAQGYGESEKVLGNALTELELAVEARIISKFDPGLDHLDKAAMSEALDKSLNGLKVPYLYGMMLHREEMLTLWDKGLSDILHEFTLSGKIKNTGISVYSPDKAVRALNTDGINMVQLPTNILDRRFERAGVFELAIREKKQIYIRSVFLQGLILMDAEEIPKKMAFAVPVIKKLEAFAADLKLSRLELALGYVKNEMPDAKVVFGADDTHQVRNNRACWEKKLPTSVLSEAKSLFDGIDENILNPLLWKN